MKAKILIIFFLIVISFTAQTVFAAPPQNSETASGDNLAVLWTSGDTEVAFKVCLMYTHAAKTQKWFEEVRLIVWGPSSRNLAGDKKLQEKVKKMMADGVKVEACIACAKMYGVVDDLRELGIEVKGMGKPLTKYLKIGWKVLTF